MTAQIVAFDTRADLGLEAPRSVSKNIEPGKGGVAVHYGGSTPNPAPSDHTICMRTWKSWQYYHLHTKGWADIAYTAGFCNHGHVLAGRGYGIRTAANGTNDSNDRFYAFCWVGGGDARPSSQALDALEWLVQDARKNGGAGTAVKPHSYFYATACPGVVLSGTTPLWDGKPVGNIVVTPVPAPAPKPRKEKPYPLPTRPRLHWYGRNDWTAYSHSGFRASDRDEIRLIQKALISKGFSVGPDGADGYIGDKTAAAIAKFQRSRRLLVDRKVGPNTWAALDIPA